MKTLFSRIGVANDGLGYSTQLSPSSLKLTAMSTKILVVPGKYAYQVGDTVRIILAADTTKFITGKISTITESATDTTYAIYASAVSAFDMSTNYTGWKLSLAGVNGVNGTPGAAGVGYPQLELTGGSYSYLMQVGGITLRAVTSLFNTGYAIGTDVQLTGLDQNTYEPAAYGYGKITAISGDNDITIVVETVQGDMVNNFNGYALNLSGVRGATGATGATGSTGATGATGLSANRNRIVNGDMRIDQRNAGASQTVTTSGAYTVDRFFVQPAGANVTTQQVSGSGRYKNALRITGAASVTQCYIQQKIEALNSYDLAGQTVTVTIRASSSTLTSLTCYVERATAGVNNWSTLVTDKMQAITITSIPTDYTFQATLSGSATDGIRFILSTGAFTSGTLDITGVQLEKGSTATEFDHRAYGAELALCQRYYFQATADSVGDRLGVGYVESANGAYIYTQFPIEMRTSPTALLTSGVSTDYSLSVAGSVQAVSQNPSFHTSTKWNATTTFLTSSAITPGQAVQARAGSGNAYLAWSAEL